MSASVNYLFKRIRRKWPSRDTQYFLVWELTKAGWPHAHLLLRAPYIPQKWLARNWQDLTGAPIVDIRAIRHADHVAHYVAKYLAKDPQVPAGMKRYRHSRHFFSILAPADLIKGRKFSSWTLERVTTHELGVTLSYTGFVCIAQSDGSVIAFPRGHPAQPELDSIVFMYPKEATR